MASFIPGLVLLAVSLGQGRDDAELLAQARIIEQRNTAISNVWPGFWPAQQAFVLYRPPVGAAFGGEASPGGASFRPGLLEDVQFPYVIDYASGADNTILLRLDGTDDDLGTLFHEQFHDYQSAAFVWTGEVTGEFVDVSGIADREAFTIAVEGERRLLAAALSSSDPTERQRLTRQYLYARNDRLRGVPDAVRWAEDYREWTEGTAEYAAVMALEALDPNGPNAALQIGEQLKQSFLATSDSFVTAVFRRRAYGVGAAQAWMLDDLQVPDWQRRVEAGANLTALLDEGLRAVGVTEAGPPPALDTSVQESIRHQLRGLPLELTNAKDFLDSRPNWFVIELDLGPSRASSLSLNFSADHTPLANGAFALQNVTELLVEIGDFSVLVRGQPVLFEAGGGVDGDIRHKFTIAVSDATLIALTGSRLSEMTSEELTLRLPSNAIIETVDGQPVLRVRQ